MNIDKNDYLPLKSPPPYGIIITVADECPVSAHALKCVRDQQSASSAVRHACVHDKNYKFLRKRDHYNGYKN